MKRISNVAVVVLVPAMKKSINDTIRLPSEKKRTKEIRLCVRQASWHAFLRTLSLICVYYKHAKQSVNFLANIRENCHGVFWTSLDNKKQFLPSNTWAFSPCPSLSYISWMNKSIKSASFPLTYRSLCSLIVSCRHKILYVALQ
jgi:hypothetical protein